MMTGNRRSFLKHVGGMTAASAFGVLAGRAAADAPAPVSSRIPLPDWALREIGETKRRIDDWRKTGENPVFFVSITDVHSGLPDMADPIDWSDPKSHILIAQEAVRQLGAAALLDLGDSDYQQLIGWRGPKPTPAEADELIRRRIETQFKLYRDFERPVYFCRGNHDRGRTNKEFTTAEFGQFNRLAEKHGHVAVLGGENTYGYFDVPSAKTRLFFLDSSELGYYGFTEDQIAFVAKGLESLPNDWTAVATEHYCIVEAFGRWLDVNKPLARIAKPILGHARNGELLHRLFAGFVHSEAGGQGRVKWDFTGRPQRRFACCLCGDSHYDNLGALDNVCYVVSQGYGGCDPRVLVPGANMTRNYWSQRKNMPLIDVLGIKRVGGIGAGRVFRIGAGGAARDREWFF